MTMGSGSLAAMSVFETGYREDMGEAEAIGTCLTCGFACLPALSWGPVRVDEGMETAVLYDHSLTHRCVHDINPLQQSW